MQSLKKRLPLISNLLKNKELPSSFSGVINSLPWRYFRNLAIMQIIIGSLVIISTAWMARFYLKAYITTQAQEQLRESLNLIRESIQTQNISPINWCSSLKLNWTTRYTLINSQGKVLCDNFVDPKTMKDQLHFPEIQDALRIGFSSQIRFNKVANSNLLYGAVSVDSLINGLSTRYIIRQTVPLNKLDKAMKELDRSIMIFLFPLLILTFLFSLWGSLQVSFPLRSILKKVDQMKRVTKDDSSNYLHDPRDEWFIVENTLDRAQEGLERYIDQLYNENEKMATVMESITDSILAIGLDEEILFANPQFKKNFLSKDVKKKEILNYKIWEVTRDIELQTLFNECLLKGKGVKKRNMELPIKGGKRNSFFDVKVNPVINQKGDVFGAVGVFHDVTQRKLAEQMREDFVANVSHEIRTPLTAIKGFSQIIRDTPPNQMDSVRPFFDKLEKNADRLTYLFNDILQLSLIESKNKVTKETVAPQEITEAVITNVKQSYRSKQISIETHYDIDRIWVNSPFFEQVLTNLIDNAYKYTPADGHIIVEWSKSTNTDKQKDREKKWDILTVKDSGIGIPKEYHARLFERFYRVDNSRSREMGGTGLGLAIVKHIVQIHNGKIAVESREGEGTTFSVRVPSHY